MGRLRGLSALGMPVSLLLAYLWSNAFIVKNSLMSPLQGPDAHDLTDAEVSSCKHDAHALPSTVEVPCTVEIIMGFRNWQVKNGQEKAGKFKQGLTAEEHALFPSHKLDGKGRAVLFVNSWQALQLLLSKAKDACEFHCLQRSA
eukprot:1160314-Pelagomonas_calceolata.AAC.1